jgi:ribosomal protein S18 acetylase RimI-like enzyme
MPQILPIAHEHIEGFCEAIGLVARERNFLAQIDTPPLDRITEFVINNIAKGHAQFVAVENGDVVGFCDIMPSTRPGFEHSGSLGMGVIKEWRHRGLGRALLDACIKKSLANGLTRIELEVYSDNAPAIALYRSLGFVEEGTKRHARFLDGKYQDLLLMALLFEKA